MRYTFDAFISYHSSDVAQAEALYSMLNEAGFTVWMDRARLVPGCDWHREIEAGCEASRIILPVLTPRWQTSDWTKFETYGAEDVIPIVFEGRFEDITPAPLRRFQVHTLNLDGFTDDDTAWQQLREALKRALAQPAPDKRTRVVSLRYRPAQHFVGRERELISICEALHPAPTPALTQGRTQAITGGGGIGKTVVARQYAERFWRLYQQMFWVDCRVSLQAELARIGDLIFPELVSSGAPDSDKAARALHELNGSQTRLLIFDNVDDEETIRDWIPKSGGCRTLLTSRFTGWSPAIGTIAISILPPEPSCELLRRRANRTPIDDETQATHALAESLGYLPLALEQAAAYVAEQGPTFGFSDYSRLYKQSAQDLLSMGVLGATDYPDSVMTTWSTSLAKLTPAAHVVLRIAAFLASTPIPLEIFFGSVETVRALSSEFHDTNRGRRIARNAEIYIRDAVTLLARYSLVAHDGKHVTLHTLLQTVQIALLAKEGLARWLQASVMAVDKYAPPGAHRYENKAVWTRLLPHVAMLWNHERRVHPCLTIPLLLGMGETMRQLGDHTSGIAVARELCRRSEDELGGWHPYTLAGANLLADLLAAKGELAEAESLLRYAIQTAEQVLGPEHPDTLSSANNLAHVLTSEASYDEAEVLYRRTLARSLSVLGTEHSDTLNSANNLAGLLTQTGKYDEAEELYRLTCQSRTRVLGDDHPDSFTSINDLAILLEKRGRYTEAEELFRRALTALERILGPDHPATLTSRGNLANLLRVQAKYEEAEALLRQVLARRERILGPDAPSVLVDSNNLALLLRARGDYGAAESLFHRTMRSMERVLGADHPDTLNCMNNFAFVLESNGEYAKAELLYLHIVDAYQRLLGPDHPSTLESLSNMAGLWKLRGEYERAEPLFRQVLRSRERAQRTDANDNLTTMNNLAGLLESKGEFAEARTLYTRVLRVSERDFGFDHPTTLGAANNLAGLLVKEHLYEEGEAILRRCLAHCERLLGKTHHLTCTVRLNLERCRELSRNEQ